MTSADNEDAKSPLPMTGSPIAFGRFLRGSIVELQIGKQPISYFVHRDLAMSRCPYLQGCLSNNFSESQSEKIVLDDVSPGAMDIVLEYIYTNRVGRIRPISNVDHVVVGAYILADRFCMEGLKNWLMDRLRNHYTSFKPSVKAFRTFTERGLDGSLLEDFMLEISAWSLFQNEGTLNEVTGLGELVEGGGSQVLRLFDLTREFQNDDDPTDPRGNDRCHYHYHTDTKPCHENSNKSSNKRKRDDLNADGSTLPLSLLLPGRR